MKKSVIIFGVIIAIFVIGCSAKEKDVIQNDHNEQEGQMVDKKMSDTELPEVELQKGDQGDQVLALQHALVEIGYPVETSGKYDALTTWAITDIQLQHDNLLVSGIYNQEVKEVIEQEKAVSVASKLAEPTAPDEFVEIVENPYEILVLVNKNYALPNGFDPEDLVVPDVRFPFSEDDPKKQLRKEAANALEEMFRAADDEGVTLFAQSGYRSYERQEAIFASNVERHGEDHANTYSARAGESEHQTGLVMDVTSESVGFDLNTDFGDTEEGKWVREHAHEYGFIIRYPEGKEHITEYQYEPWHLRYVGKKAAQEIAEKDLTLEEYLGAE
ncbi:D-alanyl-D-alanine carboxypeptidase family protein [Pseudogracilibacillus sp. SO30301A]|uniref:D-alanyl-D-alanine carboxypeptidase family protein n=1 Tax=Pseudogracilibacillus sp. SO30301A TaxID=3098291 RepID=UPI00300DCECC